MPPPTVNVSSVLRNLRNVVSTLQDASDTLLEGASQATFAREGFAKYQAELNKFQTEMAQNAQELNRLRTEMATAPPCGGRVAPPFTVADTGGAIRPIGAYLLVSAQVQGR